MVFLGIISWKGVSRSNGEEGGCFSVREGASFLSGGSPHGRASVLIGGGGWFEKNWKMLGVGALPSHALPTMGNPVQTCEKSHATHQVGVRWHAMIIPFRTP